MLEEETVSERTKEKLALEVIDRLKREYPDADCTLDYNEAWKLLVSVRLAAQCTDARVNVVVEKLYEKYPDVRSLAAADVDDIEAIVRPCGLGRSKARDISACMKILDEEYGGNVPEDFDALLKLPGGGEKERQPHHGGRVRQAGHRDGHPLHPPGEPHRPGGRGQGSQEGGDGFVEADPPEEGNDFCHRLVNHGREVCTARTRPHCDRCLSGGYL